VAGLVKANALSFDFVSFDAGRDDDELLLLCREDGLSPLVFFRYPDLAFSNISGYFLPKPVNQIVAVGRSVLAIAELSKMLLVGLRDIMAFRSRQSGNTNREYVRSRKRCDYLEG